MTQLTQGQIENIQIDHGILYKDFGIMGKERQIAPTRGGGNFKVTKSIREIEYDGRKGKTKGMQVLEELDCSLTIGILDMSIENLALALPYLTYEGEVIKAKPSNLDIIADSAYTDNFTLFAKVSGGGYKKITIYSGMNESDLEINAQPKAEGVLNLEISGHWNPLTEDVLFEIEDVLDIEKDQTPFTVITTTPAHNATGFAKGGTLTVEVSEQVLERTLTGGNVTLTKLDDYSFVNTTINYNIGNNIISIKPVNALAPSADYLLTLTGVRSVTGKTLTNTNIKFKIGA